MSNMLTLSVTITLILIIISKSLNSNKSMTKEKSSSFECGFSPQDFKNSNVSGQFYMIALLFIVFDMEISFLIPLMNNMKISSRESWLLFLIVISLYIGTLMEWKKGLIEWAK